MRLSVNEELRRTFELATLRKEAKAIKSPDQWWEIQDLRWRCIDAREKEKKLYLNRHSARVEQRRRQLIDEAGTVRREHKPGWAGSDRFDPDITFRQAQRDVRLAHARRIQRIDDFERDRLTVLVDRFREENRMRGVAVQEFGHAADRRGIERRRDR